MSHLPYELVKELKDSGYPQKMGMYVGKNGSGSGPAEWLGKQGVDDPCYAPFLTELIEACGNAFGSLSPARLVQSKFPEDHDRIGQITEWYALRHDPVDAWPCGEPECCPSCGGVGKTPEEAVARLWLVLNAK